MALFESYERRIKQINEALNSYGIASIEEAEKITKDAGLDVYKMVEGIQPICFENAKWAYTVGAAIAIKKGCRKAAEAAAALNIPKTAVLVASTGVIGKQLPIDVMKESVTGCTHCGVCTENCEFLKKYDLTIGDTEKLSKMAYHCFLCGKCSKVCPQGIDGREIVLQIRRHRVKEAGGRIPEKGYGMLLWEKEDYKFRRYTGTGKTALFFGCNFPSFYPETTRYLGKLLAEKADAFSVFDCCGKPIAELGLEEKETVILERLNKKLLEAGVREVVMVCPNCYAFLKDKLSVPVISIYEKLQELGLGNRIMEEQNIFLPCPDREKRELLKQIRPFLTAEPKILSSANCCGLGGCAALKEPELAAQMAKSAGSIQNTSVYCASCAGNLTRAGGKNIKHLLVQILGREEVPDVRHSLWNRVRAGR